MEVQVASASTQVVEEYKKSKDFEDQVAEGAYDAFQLEFMECKKQVVEAFLELDLGGIIAIEPDQEEEVEKEEGEARDTEKVEARNAEQVTKEVADVRLEEAIIQETITKVMAESETVIDAVVEAFEVGLT